MKFKFVEQVHMTPQERSVLLEAYQLFEMITKHTHNNILENAASESMKYLKDILKMTYSDNDPLDYVSTEYMTGDEPNEIEYYDDDDEYPYFTSEYEQNP